MSKKTPAPVPQGHKAMAPRKDAPPGLEQDSHGKTIPLSQRTKDDREKATAAPKTG